MRCEIKCFPTRASYKTVLNPKFIAFNFAHSVLSAWSFAATYVRAAPQY